MTQPRIVMLLANCTYPEDGRARREAGTLVEAGYAVTVICPRGPGQPRHDTVGGVRVRRYRLPTPPGAVGYVVEHVWAVLASLVLSLRLARGEGFDVVHAHNPPDLLVLVGAVHQRLGRRFVYDHHDLAPDLYLARFGERSSRRVHRALRWLEAWCCRAADHVIASNESYAEVERSRHGVPDDRITVVRNGPELARLRPQPPDPDLRAGADLVVTFVGVIGPQDGVDHLLRAVAALDPARRGVRCLIVGDGDAVPGLRRLAAHLGLGDAVTFVGTVPFDDVARYIASADICVEPAPSNPYNERSTMIKIMEYLALERPVVAFDLAENRRTAGDCALYARANDDASLAEMLAVLADDPALRQRLGRAGRQRMEEEFAWHLIAPRLVRAYDSILERVCV